LAACIKADKAFETLVAEGYEREAFTVMDGNRPRSAGDILCIAGLPSGRNLAATLTLIDQYKHGIVASRRKTPNSRILVLADEYPLAVMSMRNCDFKRNRGLIPPSVLSACHYLFAEHDDKLAEEFVQKVQSGEKLVAGEPVYLLRELLIRNQASSTRAKLQRDYMMAVTIKAWNAMRTRQQIKMLRYSRNETFPQIV